MPTVTPYSVIVDAVIDKMKSLGLPNIVEEEAYDMIVAHMRAAIVKFRVCKQNLSNRNDITEDFGTQLSDEEIEIISSLVLIEYLTANYINVPELLKQSLTSRDFQSWSSANHIKELRELRDTYKRETNQMISAYTHYDTDMFATLKQRRVERLSLSSNSSDTGDDGTGSGDSP